jgi:peptidoglycan/xylan/chitin deacetylase (PgdA/CDA1 family)
MKRESFIRQMDKLLRWAKPVAVNENISYLNSNHYAGVTFDDGFTSVKKNALPELRRRKIPATFFIPANCLGQRPSWIKDTENPCYGEFVMALDQLKQVAMDDLFSIGSHCLTHRNLTLLDETEAKKEILESKDILENMLQKEVRILSFPYGVFDQREVDLAKQAGYERVFSILPILAYRDSDEYVTGRVNVSPDDWSLEFFLKLCGAYRWMPLAFYLKQKFSHIFK